MIARANWKWFFEAPLTSVWRRRLDLAAGVVMSGAAVIGLGSFVHPDPAKVAAMRGTPMLMSTPSEDWHDGVYVAAPTTVTPAFENAVSAGDVTAMNKTYQRRMPLQGLLAQAAKSGKMDAVVWLLQHGADIHDDEHSIFSPVIAADGFPEISAFLRAHGAAEPEIDDAASANAPNAVLRQLESHPRLYPSTLRAAASTLMGTSAKKQLMVERLLAEGADPNGKVGEETPLGGAITACDGAEGNPDIADGCMRIVHLLLDHGAVVSGDALGAALSLPDEARTVPLDTLLEHPFDKGVTATALARATRARASDVKRVIAKGGIDWTWHDGEADEALPVLSAVRQGDRDFVRELLDAGAPADSHYKEGTSPLAEAIDGTASNPDYARIVELLVERGANVNRRLADGRTPLFAAAESGDIRTVNFLLAHGAQVNELVLDDTALDAAEQHANTAAARILHAHGGRRARRSDGLL